MADRSNELIARLDEELEVLRGAADAGDIDDGNDDHGQVQSFRRHRCRPREQPLDAIPSQSSAVAYLEDEMVDAAPDGH